MSGECFVWQGKRAPWADERTKDAPWAQQDSRLKDAPWEKDDPAPWGDDAKPFTRGGRELGVVPDAPWVRNNTNCLHRNVSSCFETDSHGENKSDVCCAKSRQGEAPCGSAVYGRVDEMFPRGMGAGQHDWWKRRRTRKN